MAVDVTGTYNVTVTDGLGCTSTMTSNITVNPEVNASITGGTQFCTSGVLTASVAGGGVPNGARYYIRDGEPWGQNVNSQALDAVFGAGNWNVETFAANAATVFSPPLSCSMSRNRFIGGMALNFIPPLKGSSESSKLK